MFVCLCSNRCSRAMIRRIRGLALQALLGEWWELVNECRAVAAAADLDKAGPRVSKRPRGQEAQDEARESAPISLLDDVEQDAFMPG